MKRIILLAAVVALSLNIMAQKTSVVPKNYVLDKETDYKAYEKDVLNTIDWLVETPVNEQPGSRSEAIRFLTLWFVGTPDVHIEVSSEVVTFISNYDLFLMFMAGWTKHDIETNTFDNKIDSSVAGIELAIQYYEKNKGAMKKDKDIEKYIKLQKQGKLKEHLEKVYQKLEQQ